MLDRKKFEKELPQFVSNLFPPLMKEGFSFVLVGGTVRDFFLSSKLGFDWDIEVTHKTLSFGPELWKEFAKKLAKYGQVSYLPFEVIRLEMNQHQLEFSPPRIEIFLDEAHHHKNFEAKFDFSLSFQEAIKRRDFTINAMGVRFLSLKEFEFLDPSEGLRHLREGTLHPCSDDFTKDPVRFLRALRFARKFKLSKSQELNNLLNQMKLGELTPSYIWSEMQKSHDPIGYYSDLLESQKEHPELQLPVVFKKEEIRSVLKDPSKHECWMIALEWIGVSCAGWQQYFSLSADSTQKIARWARETKSFKELNPEEFHGDFEKVYPLANFLKLFDWYFATKQLLQKYPGLPLIKMIEDYLPDWIHLYRFEPLKDVKHVDPPLRAKYQLWNLCQRL